MSIEQVVDLREFLEPPASDLLAKSRFQVGHHIAGRGLYVLVVDEDAAAQLRVRERVETGGYVAPIKRAVKRGTRHARQALSRERTRSKICLQPGPREITVEAAAEAAGQTQFDALARRAAGVAESGTAVRGCSGHDFVRGVDLVQRHPQLALRAEVGLEPRLVVVAGARLEVEVEAGGAIRAIRELGERWRLEALAVTHVPIDRGREPIEHACETGGFREILAAAVVRIHLGDEMIVDLERDARTAQAADELPAPQHPERLGVFAEPRKQVVLVARKRALAA